MCGIAGILRLQGFAGGGRPDALLRAMASSMAHRGPDGEGIWVSDDGRAGLAHRRLAIVDLSDAAGQPMSNEDGTVWVTFNGEIYNHLDLRRGLESRGHRFKTDHADTEVLVHGYEEWGLEGLAERVDGMFAFGLWDEGRGVLSLVRDRVGVKPVYFTRYPGAFLFASEIKALFNDPGVPRDLDEAALNHYLSFMVAPAPLTMFKGVFKLPAGHLLEIDRAGRMEARRYWNAVPGRGVDSGALAGLEGAERGRFYAAGIRRRLEKAIEKRMMADVPFGVFLSGGIDSSANVALMSRRMDRPVETFTVGFKDHPRLNELDYAGRVAREFSTNHHEVLIDEGDMMGYLDDLVHHQDEPLADWVCIPLYFVSKLASESGVKVVQVGEGADEQFCGYDSYMTYLRTYRSFWRPYMRMVPGFLRRAVGFAARAAAGLDVAGLDEADSGAVIDGFMAPFDRDHPDADFLTRMIHNEFRLRLPELLLMRVDKITMSTSIEGRVPYLDHELVEYTMDIPMSWKLDGFRPKALFKEAVRDLLPADIVNRPKMGFAAPMKEWMRGDFGRRAKSQVLGSRLMERGYFNRSHVARLFSDHMAGRRDNALHLWTLFNLAAWHDHWIG